MAETLELTPIEAKEAQILDMADETLRDVTESQESGTSEERGIDYALFSGFMLQVAAHETEFGNTGISLEISKKVTARDNKLFRRVKEDDSKEAAILFAEQTMLTRMVSAVVRNSAPLLSAEAHRDLALLSLDDTTLVDSSKAGPDTDPDTYLTQQYPHAYELAAAGLISIVRPGRISRITLLSEGNVDQALTARVQRDAYDFQHRLKI